MPPVGWLGGFAALMLKLVLRFWMPRYRANPNHTINPASPPASRA
jgi:hypothetical protein